MSEELDKIDEKLTKDEELKGRQKLPRNSWFTNFNLLSTENPRDTNRTIIKAMLIMALILLAYLISFYI